MRTTTCPAASTVYDLAERVRLAVEGCWPEQETCPGDDEVPRSSGQCGRSSCVLLHVLSEELPEGGWRLAGGVEDVRDAMNADDIAEGTEPGGMTWNGCWQDHYWVVSDTYGLIVDVTADQFGHAPVLVCGADDARYHENLLPGAADRHSSDWSRDVADWIETVRSRVEPSFR